MPASARRKARSEGGSEGPGRGGERGRARRTMRGLSFKVAAVATVVLAGPAHVTGVVAACINSCTASCSVEDSCTAGCYAWQPSSNSCRNLCRNSMGLTACAKNRLQGLGLVWNPVAADCAAGCTWPMLYNGKCDTACNTAACENDAGSCSKPQNSPTPPPTTTCTSIKNRPDCIAAGCSYNIKTKKCTRKMGRSPAGGRVLEDLEGEDLEGLEGEDLEDLEGEDLVEEDMEDSLEEPSSEADEEALLGVEG